MISEWQRTHPEKVAALKKRWAKEHPERKRASDLKYRLSHPEKFARSTWAARLKRLYGITPEQYYTLLEAQGGVCKICKAEPKPNKKLDVDHDHKNGRVRGLLCGTCNKVLGLVKESGAYLNALARYMGAW